MFTCSSRRTSKEISIVVKHPKTSANHFIADRNYIKRQPAVLNLISNCKMRQLEHFELIPHRSLRQKNTRTNERPELSPCGQISQEPEESWLSRRRDHRQVGRPTSEKCIRREHPVFTRCRVFHVLL